MGIDMIIPRLSMWIMRQKSVLFALNMESFGRRQRSICINEHMDAQCVTNLMLEKLWVLE